MLLAFADPIQSVGQLSEWLQQRPFAVLSAVFIIGLIGVSLKYFSAMTQNAVLNAEHVKEIASLQKEHSAELLRERDEHMKTALQVIPLNQGLIRMIEGLEELTRDTAAQRKMRRKSSKAGMAELGPEPVTNIHRQMAEVKGDDS